MAVWTGGGMHVVGYISYASSKTQLARVVGWVAMGLEGVGGQSK
jgi:hypothetical protein